MTSSDRDLRLKLLTKILFNQMGYYAEIAVPIYAKEYGRKYAKSQVTDFDVLGIKFEGDLFPLLVAAECKSDERHAAEQILKLVGTLHSYGMFRGFFVKERIDPNAREVARKNRVTSLDTQEIEQLLNSKEVDLHKLLPVYSHWEQTKSNLLAQLGDEFAAALSYLSQEFWNIEQNRNLPNLVYLFKQTSSNLDTTPPSLFLFYFMLLRFTIAILFMASHVVKHNLRSFEDEASNYFFGGVRNRRDREVLSDKIASLAPQADNSVSAYPPYFDKLQEVLARVLKSPNSARNMVSFLNRFLETHFSASKNDFERFAQDKNNVITLKLCQDVCEFVTGQAKIDANVAHLLMQY